MRILFTVFAFSFFIFINLESTAQSIVIQEGDTIYICEPQSVTLHAEYIGTDSSDLQSSIPLSTIDDTHSDVVNIGFSFTYYGNTYTQCVLSTNNYITFDLSNANMYSPWPISGPIPSGGYPAYNAIFGPWHDTYPGAWGAAQPGWVSYTTVGDAPNRVFIFNMCMVPMYSCVDLYYSGQIKLFETTNIIEFHITHKDVCTTWNSGQAILGCQNIDGTVAEVVNGYNDGVQWTADNVAWQLTPNGSNDYNIQSIAYDPVQVYATNQLQWFGNGIAGQVFSDTVVADITQSGWIFVDFFGCFGTTLSQAGSDSIYIMIGDPATVVSQRVSACNIPADNALFANFLPSDNAPFDLVWTDSAGNILQVDSNETVVDSLTNIPSGIYHLQVVNAIGCTLNYDFNIPVHTITPAFTYTPDPLICQNQTVTFTNSSTGSIDSYYWNFGDNQDDTAENPTHIYYGAGDSILVQMIIYNDTFPSCTDTAEAWLNIHPNIVADFYYDTPLCAGLNIKFTDQSFLHPVAWQWFDGDSLISTDNTAQMVKPSEGVYPVTLIVTDSLCGVDTLSDLVYVYNYPVVDLGNDTLLCPGESITLDAGNPGMTYQWSNGFTTQTVDLQINETTPVIVTVGNNGCEVDDEILITMNCNLHFPNAFSPNGDGINDLFRPHLINMESYTMHIYNRWGQLVYTLDEGLGVETEGWDGTFKGLPAPMGAYVYYAKGMTIRNNPVSAEGNFVLLR